MGGLVLLFLLLGYFIPSALALARHHHNAGAIITVNLLLGWTLLGWIASLVWSLTSPAPAPALPVLTNAVPATKTCPKCAEDVKGAALVCRFCGHEFG